MVGNDRGGEKVDNLSKSGQSSLVLHISTFAILLSPKLSTFSIASYPQLYFTEHRRSCFLQEFHIHLSPAPTTTTTI